MKRFRITNFDFDSRASSLNLEIKDEWDEEVKRLHRENQLLMENSLMKEFGTMDWARKLSNISDLSSSPVSVIAFHNKFFSQIRKSFIMGSYYPALTGACALGERILNHLILNLRDEFKTSPEYNKVYRKNSFTDWDEAIDLLVNWEILLPEVVISFKKLKVIRHTEAIHFNVKTEENDREVSLRAIRLLLEIIKGQFAGFGTQPWFIENTKGAFFIKKSWENNPFIKLVYLPNCIPVGPYHAMTYNQATGHFEIIDDYPYENNDIRDEDFVTLLESKRPSK